MAIKRGEELGVDPRRDKYSVQELLDMYLKTLTRSEATQVSYRGHAKTLLEMFGKRKAHTINTKDARLFAKVMELRGLQQATIAHRLGIMRAALGWAEREGKVTHNGLGGMRISKGTSKVYPVPTVEQLGAIMRVAPERVQRVIILGLYTGCRIGPCELFRLRWEHVDFTNRTIYIPAALKNRRAGDLRPIPMRDDLIPALWTWRRNDTERYPGCEFVINYKGKKWTGS